LRFAYLQFADPIFLRTSKLLQIRNCLIFSLSKCSLKKMLLFKYLFSAKQTCGRILCGLPRKGRKGGCAAKAYFYCPSMNSHRPRSQNIPKESTLKPEKDSSIKRPRSHISLEKSSQNYKPLEN